MKRKIAELIKQKGLRHFASISPQDSIKTALTYLEKTNSGALLVISENNLKGIFTEKDFARSVLRNDITLSSTVDKVMTTSYYYIQLSNTIEESLQAMSKSQVEHLPVFENDTPIALVSMAHIMEFLVEDKENQIRQLTTYITGSCLSLDLSHNKREQNNQEVI